MVKVVFEKGRRPISLLIKLITRSRFSHVGIVIDDILYETDIGYNFRKINFDWDETEYEEITIKVNENEKNGLIEFLDNNLDRKYDRKENLRYILKLLHLDWLLKDNDRKWNCVEATISGLRQIRKYEYISDIDAYSPYELYKIMKMNYKINIIRMK